MDIQDFIKKHKATWRDLEEKVAFFRKRPKEIQGKHIDELTQAYKKVSSHYAYLKTIDPRDEATLYLNQLVSSAHHLLYQEQNRSSQQLKYFFQSYFIALIHKRRFFIVLAFLLFTLGGAFGAVSIAMDPLNLYLILPPEMTAGIDPEQIGEGHDQISEPLMATTIMTNNIQVAILAFLGGITFGIFTVYILLFNGLIIGAMAAVFWQAGQTYMFWAYILPHGILELAIIFVAGGAGLYMGYRMLVPGTAPRKYQIGRAASESLQLLLGTIPLFVIAGLIEGYVTPSTTLSPEMKYAFALMTLALIVLYYVYGIYKRKEMAPESR
ncbi:stage II sporulation protein M [Salicibibacter cibarius]|uniref:Stage II sporulation protein M n=2 Tax=Salicibibacter cibarius TaxID=2743000 RepID=A0A7T6Z8N4_9BACI|nr:stage II sporulation protein M [Salicibibacter cibarius]QQK78416.1 stage II sporulation protein M [Salicibibacter cibarius]